MKKIILIISCVVVLASCLSNSESNSKIDEGKWIINDTAYKYESPKFNEDILYKFNNKFGKDYEIISADYDLMIIICKKKIK